MRWKETLTDLVFYIQNRRELPHSSGSGTPLKPPWRINPQTLADCTAVRKSYDNYVSYKT
jgi:hypothetical protein